MTFSAARRRNRFVRLGVKWFPLVRFEVETRSVSPFCRFGPDGFEPVELLERAAWRLLGEGDALVGEEFLGVDGLVDGDEVGPEVGEPFRGDGV